MNDRQQLREILTASILAQVSREVDVVLAEAELSDDAGQKIKDDLVANTERTLDACTSDELQSELAFDRYVESCVRDAEIQVRQFRVERAK